MRSSVDRYARPITLTVFSACVALVAGSQFFAFHYARSANGLSPIVLAGTMFDHIVTCSYFVFAVCGAYLAVRHRKNAPLNWMACSFGIFLFGEALSHSLATTSYSALHPWVVSVLRVVSAGAAVC